MVTIRDYDHKRDRIGLRDCFIELQNYERQFSPGMPDGSAIADAYLDLMFARCEKWEGKVSVAESAGEVVGFVCVWARFKSEEPDDDPSGYAFVSDLVVNPGCRRRGIGRDLLSAAERYARTRGAHCLRLRVLADNTDARHFYESTGFTDYEVELAKQLA